MKISFGEIKKTFTLQEKVGPLKLDFGYRCELEVRPVDLTLAIEPVKRGHRVVGAFDYDATIPCSRCLETARLTGATDFLLEYRPAGSAPVPEDQEEIELEETQVVYYEDDTLSLDDLVSQQMYLEVPERILCAEDCRGLCSRCGANLNPGPCPCPPEVDPRLTPLGKLHPTAIGENDA